MLSHNTLANYYQLTFSLAQHHKYSIAEIENMFPYERDIYVGLLTNYLEKEKIRMENMKRK